MLPVSFETYLMEHRQLIERAEKRALLMATLGPAEKPASILPFSKRHVRPLTSIVEISRPTPAA